MYTNFYGLSELPFELTANQEYLFLNGSQREALSILQYGLSSAKSLTALIGEAGTGKTTLLKAALKSDRCRNVRSIYLNNPRLRPEEFNQLLALKLDLGTEAAESKVVLLERLEGLLRERRDAGQTVALVIDEAQSLSLEMLEEVRLLANIETPSTKLLPLVLAGQPELAARFEDPALRQLQQRVTLRAQLQPFEVADTAAYIASRITTAGGVPGTHLHARRGAPDPRVRRRHSANDQRDLRQRARHGHGVAATTGRSRMCDRSGDRSQAGTADIRRAAAREGQQARSLTATSRRLRPAVASLRQSTRKLPRGRAVAWRERLPSEPHRSGATHS